MSELLLAGTELVTQPEAPRQDQLPDGWYVTGYDVALDRWWSGGEAWSICLRFTHATGVNAEVEWRTHQLPLEYGWLGDWLRACEHMPGQVAVRAEGPQPRYSW